MGGLGFLSGLYAWQIEPFWLEFVEMDMPVRNLPKALEGKTLMQISDIHVGNAFDHNYIIKSFKKAQAYDPDFVVYTGDYITLHNEVLQRRELEEVLANCVKGKLATVGILGNHDYGTGWRQSEMADLIQQMLEEKNITVLRNEQRDFSGLNFIGLDDYWGLNFDPQKIMSVYDKSKPSVLLCHNPDVCDLDVWNGYEGWILAGHTHGGQCKPPFLPPPMLPVVNKKYTSGKMELSGNRTLYINRALGHLYQIRFNVRPEITIFKLTSE